MFVNREVVWGSLVSGVLVFGNREEGVGGACACARSSAGELSRGQHIARQADRTATMMEQRSNIVETCVGWARRTGGANKVRRAGGLVGFVVHLPRALLFFPPLRTRLREFAFR